MIMKEPTEHVGEISMEGCYSKITSLVFIVGLLFFFFFVVRVETVDTEGDLEAEG